ncbi:sodium-coupled monocarboxylate transporter 1 [Musca domestica]|uniref:Sodium-coupled monocarboxylate transporter 1 n=1 Tax=Musca domestica TaxID=7370 RepID=T1PCA0_MUSDO|nr:sodium-coupled monocarboxylate transporter 1 [Musca domestica]XP_058981284.1 sodium-coupled monocarboxylate transporter 1 [Musca domestica]
MAKELHTLGWDYVMFALFIAFTVFTPLWKRLFGKQKARSKADYVFATGGVSIVAVMISIARGTLGVRTVLGYPSELFYRGSAMWEIIYGMASAYPLVCFIFVPVYFNLGITSVYQYLDLRFKSRMVRCLASATYIIRQICSLGVTVYTPSVALSTVIGIPYWASISGMATICIFFSIKGGLKAAINADVIQTVTVILVSIVIIVKGTIFSGGPKRVYDINQQDGRLSFFNFTGDFSVRVDTTSAWLGQLFVSLSQFGCQQNFMQRYVSLKSLNEVKRAMMSNIPIIFVFFSLSWITGLVIYSSYASCDPLAEGYINKADEILPFYVEDQLAFIPGFVGIFMATLFNGALCMMVSNLNSMATVIWEDFLTLIPKFKNLSDRQQLSLIKTVTVICGILIMGVAFGVGLLSGVIESSMMAFSATSGPLLGCFILAMLVPIANWKGTSAGMITACAFVLWIIGGAATIDKSESNKFLPTSTEGCSNFTFSQSIHKPTSDEYSFLPTQSSWLMQHTPVMPLDGSGNNNNDNNIINGYGSVNSNYVMLNDTLLAMVANLSTTAATAATTTAAVEERTPLQHMYSISYMYYSLIGTALTVLIGYIASYLTQDPKDAYDAKLLHPAVLRLYERFWSGSKPYYIKDVNNTIVTVLGSNGSVSVFQAAAAAQGGGSGSLDGGVDSAAASADVGNGNSGAKINHAFEPQNEANIIIGADNSGNGEGKGKNPMDVIFIKSLPAASSPPKTSTLQQNPAQTTVTTTTTSMTNVNNDAGVNVDSVTLEMPKTQNTSSSHLPSVERNQFNASHQHNNTKENV